MSGEKARPGQRTETACGFHSLAWQFFPGDILSVNVPWVVQTAAGAVLVPRLFPRSSCQCFFFSATRRGGYGAPCWRPEEASCPPESACRTSDPQRDAIRRLGLREARRPGGWSSHEGDQLSVLVEDAPARSRGSFCHGRTRRENGRSETGTWAQIHR